MELRSTRLWIMNELDRRVKKNPSYSLRSFARYLGLSPSYLSRIISNQRTLSLRSALVIAESLELSEKEKEELISLVKEEEGYRKSEESEKSDYDEEVWQLNLDAFNVISEWYHFGITQLLTLDNFKNDLNWIAGMLEITPLEARLAIERLSRLGLIDRNSKGEIFRTKVSLKSTDDIRSDGLRKFHFQILKKVQDSLENVPLRERDISSMTVAIDEENIPKAKEEIRKFQNKMVRLLQKGKKTRVYSLGVNLIPLSHSSGGRK